MGGCHQDNRDQNRLGRGPEPRSNECLFSGKSGHLADLPQRQLTIEMLELPPPIWALVYVLTAAALGWFFGWPKVPGFPLVSLGISLVAISWILPVWAIVLFRREGTEVEPTSGGTYEYVARVRRLLQCMSLLL